MNFKSTVTEVHQSDLIIITIVIYVTVLKCNRSPFKYYVNFVEGPCGYVQNNTLLSPGYPNYYPANTDCNYWVYIPSGKALQIYFDDFQVNDCG